MFSFVVGWLICLVCFAIAVGCLCGYLVYCFLIWDVGVDGLCFSVLLLRWLCAG